MHTPSNLCAMTIFLTLTTMFSTNINPRSVSIISQGSQSVSEQLAGSYQALETTARNVLIPGLHPRFTPSPHYSSPAR